MLKKIRSLFGKTENPKNKPLPIDVSWIPGQQIDLAVTEAIWLFSSYLSGQSLDLDIVWDVYNRNCDVRKNLDKYIGESVIYKNGEIYEFLVLSITKDFEEYQFQPHCNLWEIINTTIILENIIVNKTKNEALNQQVLTSLFYAHMLKIWLSFVKPVELAILNQDHDEAFRLLTGMRQCMTLMAAAGPKMLTESFDLNAFVDQWCCGIPTFIKADLDENVKRMNHLPITPFIENVLVKHLASAQMPQR